MSQGVRLLVSVILGTALVGIAVWRASTDDWLAVFVCLFLALLNYLCALANAYAMGREEVQ